MTSSLPLTASPAPDDALEDAALAVLLALGLGSALLCITAWAGIFHAAWVAVVGAAVLATLGWKLKARRRYGLAGLFILIVPFGALLLFYPPGDFVLGGLDQGVYLNTAAHLARTGGFSGPDSLLAQTGEAGQRAVVAQNAWGRPHLYPGFYWDQQDATWTTQFPFLMTVWVAVGALVAGETGARWVPLLVTALASVYCCLLARRLFGNGAALAAAVLLTAHGVQVWHARLTLSEPLVQLLFCGGLWAAACWRTSNSSLAAVTAGVALGLLPLIKTDAFVLSVVAAAVFAAWFFSDPPAHRRAFLLPLGALYGLALLHYATVARAYVADQLPLVWQLALIACLSASGLALAPALSGYLRRFGESKRPLLWAGIALAGGLPLLALPLLDVDWPLLARTLWDGLYLSPLDVPVLVAFLWALWQLRSRGGSWEGWIVLLAVCAGAALYLAVFARYYRSQEHLPLFMWTTRRLVPTVLPALALMEAAALMALCARLGRGAPLALALALGVLVAARSPDLIPVARAQEYAGAPAAVATVSAALEPNAVVLMDNDATGIRFSTPLRFIEERAAYVVWDASQRQGLQALVRTATQAGRPVYYLSTYPSGVAAALDGYGLRQVQRWRFELPEFERVSDRRPFGSYLYVAEPTLYRVVDRVADVALPLRIKLGSEAGPGYRLLRSGFSSVERAPNGESFRWASGRAEFQIPPGVTPARIYLRIGTGKPEPAPPSELVLKCAGAEVARLTATAFFAELSMDAPPACLEGDRVVTIESPTWTKPEFGTAADQRPRGIMVSIIGFE